MAPIRILFALVLLTATAPLAADTTYMPATVSPPPPPREFRGAWLATVANLDWPSQPGMSVATQKAELIALLDHAAQLKLNAVILQVRPMADAVYASPLEPWSEFLTGRMGRAPEPFYDPLAFAVAEAHKRGLELHAWFNPFRVSLPPNQARSPAALNHLSRTHPELVHRYGNLLWLDPGEPAAREHVLSVILDVVRRYEVDGITFDDYFYPYPEKDVDGRTVDFPDAASWRKYGTTSGMSRDEWRRANVNQFVQNTCRSLHALKPWVKFGISPFGIWRPGFPQQIQGLDTYAKLYADSRLWLASGWLDYLSPQLYWPVDQREQSFPVLLQWWSEQNVKHRHLWPSLNASNVGTKWKPDEILRQMQIVRRQPGVSGEIFYHLRNLFDNRALTDVVRAEYSLPALVPASPWLDSVPPDKPKLSVSESRAGLQAEWATAGAEPAWLWILQFRINGVWTTEILPANQKAWTFDHATPDVIAVSAVDRVENEGAPAALMKAVPAPLRPDGKYPGLNWQRNSKH
ncbi:MAG TPA: family 10 glycosylhydrolase [Verrucomicrobiae bacterium]|nr:family 10 glycosylhydrolase [Verrucomicrobiae bacterium]